MPRTQNQILASLPREEYEAIAAKLERTPIRVGEVLAQPGDPVETIYFPESGIISIVALLGEGGTLEVAPVGREGAVGAWALTRNESSPWQMLVQADGVAQALPVAHFQELARHSPNFLVALVDFSADVTEMMARAALCNRFHSLAQRLSFWLLAMHDRVDGDIITITHEVVADMLGVHRPSVSVAIGELEAAGAVLTKRGQIEVTSRAALEGAACDCYAAVKGLGGQAQARRHVAGAPA